MSNLGTQDRLSSILSELGEDTGSDFRWLKPSVIVHLGPADNTEVLSKLLGDTPGEDYKPDIPQALDKLTHLAESVLATIALPNEIGEPDKFMEDLRQKIDEAMKTKLGEVYGKEAMTSQYGFALVTRSNTNVFVAECALFSYGAMKQAPREVQKNWNALWLLNFPYAV